jgi:ribonuclease HII
MKITHIIGVDEAGRGPLAGPVAVGAFIILDMKSTTIRNVRNKLQVDNGYPFRDSKQLSESEREDIYKILQKLRKEGIVDFKVAKVAASVIDRQGIIPAIRLGISRALAKLNFDPKKVKVFLDGSLKAPEKFSHQETLIRGDQRKLQIALASICAKVERDRYMTRQDNHFPRYGFKQHKGYGTKGHHKALKKYGKCVLHRVSYLK